VGYRGNIKSNGYNFVYGKYIKTFNWEQDNLYTTEFYEHLRVEFVSDRMSYRVLRIRRCNIVMNVINLFFVILDNVQMTFI